MWQGDIISLGVTILTWLIVAVWILKMNRRQSERLLEWKLAIVFCVGFFSFSITLPLLGQVLRIALLPLGVWILYVILRRRGSWEKYRKFAWIGFFTNFLFLVAGILGNSYHNFYFSQEDMSTYINDVSEAEIITIHPAGVKQTAFLPEAFALMDQFEPENFHSDEWYRETYEYEYDNEQRSERFPYVVKGSYSKWGSGYTPLVYLERDGKGLLITTDDAQYYFKSEQSLIGEVSAGE